MYPVHQFTDTYPHQKNQMQPTSQFYPSFEAIPPRMRADPIRYPSYHQPWPCGGSYGYAYPGQYHGCCNHTYFPEYSVLRPPFAQHALPYYPGSYPVPPGAYPAHYPMELPSYEYHKHVPEYHHCCGCPNHPCSQKNVKIEEEDCHPEKKADVSLAPLDVKNYPVEWLPPDYIKNKGDYKANEPKFDKQEEFSDGANSHRMSRPSAHWPNLLNGGFPFDMNSSRSLRRGGDSLRKQLQYDDDKPGFSLPVFWMPYRPDEFERTDCKGADVGEEYMQREPSQFEGTGVMVSGSEDRNKTGGNEDFISREGPEVMEKNNVQKTIPVKQAALSEDRKNKEGKVKENSEKHTNFSEERKSAEDSTRKKPSFLSKSVKLPPVCLRVDPLPRKRSGSSRSPSPPGDKGTSSELSKESIKTTKSLTATETAQQDTSPRNNMPERTKDVERHKTKAKIIEISDGIGSKGGNVDLSAVHVHNPNNLPLDSYQEAVASQTNHKPEDASADMIATDTKSNTTAEGKADQVEVEDKSIQVDEDKKKPKAEEQAAANKEKQPKKVKPSETEAAAIIQSAYRGYEVRRWESLKKLKQISKVREEVAELKSRIEVLEFSPDTQGVEKSRTIIEETIMNLLLRLDTIQGLHPSIRDIRKSVARELVSLQQKLDGLTGRKTAQSTEQASTAKSGEDMDTRDDTSIQEGQKEENLSEESSQVETESPKGFCSEEPHQVECTHAVDVVIDSRNLDILEMERNKEDEGENPKENSDELLRDGAAEAESQKNYQIPQVGEERINPVVGGESSLSVYEVSALSELEELPTGVLEADTPKESDLLQNENEAKKEQAPQEALMEYGLAVEELADLPQGVLSDDAHNSSKYVHLGKEEEIPEDHIMMVINAEVPDGEVLDTNLTEQRNDITLNEPVSSKVNGTLESEQNEDDDIDLLGEVGSNDILVNVPKEEITLISELADVSKVDNEDGPGTHPKVISSARAEFEECSVESQTPEGISVTELVQPSKACEEVAADFPFVENEIEYTSQGKDGVTDANNFSMLGDASTTGQECEFPAEITKLCEVENKQKLLDEKLEVEASELATGVDKIFAHSYDSATSKEVISDHVESVSLDAKQMEEKESSPPSSAASQISLSSDAFPDNHRKLVEENEKLREMMQKLIEAGQEQLTAISSLLGRVKDLEKKLSRKKKVKLRRPSRTSSGSFCLKPSNDPLKNDAIRLAY